MSCSDCSNRRRLLLNNINLAMDEEEYCEFCNIEIPFNISLFLNKNKEFYLELKKERNKLNLNCVDLNKRITYNGIDDRTTQKNVVRNIINSKSVRQVVPVEFNGLIELEIFNPFKRYPILSSVINRANSRKIIDLEDKYHENFYLYLKKGNDTNEISKKYAECLMNLFLMLKRRVR